MDSRLYFVLGDLGGNILTGLVVGWCCAMLVGVGWPMFITMLLTMAIGMLLGLIFWLPLAYFFGAMEVMLPVMFSGMVAGMVVGMWATMAPMSAAEGAGIGATCGLASLVLIWILNNSMRGVRRFGYRFEKGA